MWASPPTAHRNDSSINWNLKMCRVRTIPSLCSYNNHRTVHELSAGTTRELEFEERIATPVCGLVRNDRESLSITYYALSAGTTRKVEFSTCRE